MSGRSGFWKIYNTERRLKVVDLGYPSLDKLLGDPCEVLAGVYRQGREVVSDGLGAIGYALGEAGNAVTALADKAAPKALEVEDTPGMFGPKPFFLESSTI